MREHQWTRTGNPALGKRAAHENHRFDGSCAICQGRVEDIAEAILDAPGFTVFAWPDGGWVDGCWWNFTPDIVAEVRDDVYALLVAAASRAEMRSAGIEPPTPSSPDDSAPGGGDARPEPPHGDVGGSGRATNVP
ncbi:hypothetical protein [Nocardia gipuzkoensis]|uniref:hypothetical protein n=1 Tax=Nocardia gipuzkoensis TaxID=2749991 RepID=UPI002456120B|nr:hypothetical protein [Nocardia gipuzkoensis]